jgi:UPF0755 protein
LINKFFKFCLMATSAVVLLVAGGELYWANQPLLDAAHAPIAFSIVPGSGVRGVAQQISRQAAAQNVSVNPLLLELLARVTGKGKRVKAGNYELKPGSTPLRLLAQLTRGEFAQESLVVIEGWTFHQMRQVIAQHPALKHDTASLTDTELLAKITTNFTVPEGLFFPDTYLFGKGISDLVIYRQAHAMMMKKLDSAWQKRDPSLPYKTPYEALTMASIIEKETGQRAERGMIAGVFVNRLKSGMLLQTDPTVIYGMGDRYQGTIHKLDLLTDTPFNTYTRAGLPPSPIALSGKAAMTAAFHPEKTDALYFVARGDGSSVFSSSLDAHNRAVNQYQRAAAR